MTPRTIDETGSTLGRLSASFRDPSGIVYRRNGRIFRQINRVYQADYDHLMTSGLYGVLTQKHWLIPHREVDEAPLEPSICYRVIEPERIEFVSYPYEWCFSQLKDAALLTLAIQKEALRFGMTLKDASAYNIQFHQGRPILIDTLSFTRYSEGQPWVAYRQFCQHFLAPLALMSKVDLRLGRLLSLYIDGIPLDLASRLLPPSTRWHFGMLTHIHLHAQAQKMGETIVPKGNPQEGRKVSKAGLIGLIESLENTIKKLQPRLRRENWAEYYDHTNYSTEAFEHKKHLVSEVVREVKPRMVWDLGANTGLFSRVAAQSAGCLVISADIDPEAVEINYRQIRGESLPLLPLVLDLTNPSPGVGWNNRERMAFLERGPVDLVMALALIHHLTIGNNLPLDEIASVFASMGKYLLIEFVPKEDSQVQRLLRSREDIFGEYHLEGFQKAFEPYFVVHKKLPIAGSKRILFLLESRNY